MESIEFTGPCEFGKPMLFNTMQKTLKVLVCLARTSNLEKRFQSWKGYLLNHYVIYYSW